MKAEKRAKLKLLWEQRLKEWKASGLSQVEWCRQQNLNAHQLTYWKLKLQTQSPGHQNKLIPLITTQPQSSIENSPVIVHLGSVRLEASLHQVPELLRALKVVS
ncbi:IS66 family insertion sequence element accessory protein TnpA [Endozoicomonadaceae bacterium StTr2]